MSWEHGFLSQWGPWSRPGLLSLSSLVLDSKPHLLDSILRPVSRVSFLNVSDSQAPGIYGMKYECFCLQCRNFAVFPSLFSPFPIIQPLPPQFSTWDQPALARLEPTSLPPPSRRPFLTFFACRALQLSSNSPSCVEILINLETYTYSNLFVFFYTVFRI